MHAPSVTPEAGWEPVQPFPVMHDKTYLSQSTNLNKLRIAYFKRLKDGALMGRVWFGPEAEGPPGHAHGGSTLAVLDEALGAAAWIAGHPCITVRLTTEFRKAIPLKTDAYIEAKVEKAGRKKIICHGKLVDEKGTVFARAEGEFLKINLSGKLFQKAGEGLR